MRLIYHISDIHIKADTRDDIMYAVDRLLEYAVDESTKPIFVITGDIFDRNMNRLINMGEVANTFHDFISALKDYTVIMIPGNHDIRQESDIPDDPIEALLRDTKYDHIIYNNDNSSIILDDIIFHVHNQCIPHDPIRPDDPSKIQIGLFHEQPDMKRIMRFCSRYDALMLGDRHEPKFDPDLFWGYPGSLIQTRMGESLNKGFLRWTFDRIDGRLVRSVEHILIDLNGAYIHIDRPGFEIEDCFEYIKNVKVDWKSFEVEERVELQRFLKEEYDYELQIPKISSNDLPASSSSNVPDLRQFIEQNIENEYRDVSENLLRMWKGEIETQQYELVELSWDNLYAYGEGNVIRFGRDGEVIHLDAPNNTGKSSIINILTYALYGSTGQTVRSRRYLVNHRRSSHRCHLKIRLVSDGSIIEIIRRSSSPAQELIHGDHRLTVNSSINSYIQSIVGPLSHFKMHLATQHRDYSKIDEFITIPIVDELIEHRKEVSKLIREVDVSEDLEPSPIPIPSMSRQDISKNIDDLESHIDQLEKRFNRLDIHNSDTIDSYHHRSDIDLRRSELVDLNSQRDLIKDFEDHGIVVDEDLIGLYPSMSISQILEYSDRDLNSIRDQLRSLDESLNFSTSLIEEYRHIIDRLPLTRTPPSMDLIIHSDRFRELISQIEHLDIDLSGTNGGSIPEATMDISKIISEIDELDSHMNSEEFRLLEEQSMYRSMKELNGSKKSQKVDHENITVTIDEISKESMYRQRLNELNNLEPLEDPTDSLNEVLREMNSPEYHEWIKDISYRPLKHDRESVMKPQGYDDISVQDHLVDRSMIDREEELEDILKIIEEIDENLEDLKEEWESIDVRRPREPSLFDEDQICEMIQFNEIVEDVARSIPLSDESVEVHRDELLGRIDELINPSIDPHIHRELCSGCQSKFSLDPDVERLRRGLRSMYDQNLKNIEIYEINRSWERRMYLEKTISLLESESEVRQNLFDIQVTLYHDHIKRKVRDRSQSLIDDLKSRIGVLEKSKKLYDTEMKKRSILIENESMYRDVIRRIEESRYINEVLTQRSAKARKEIHSMKDRHSILSDRLKSIVGFLIDYSSSLIYIHDSNMRLRESLKIDIEKVQESQRSMNIIRNIQQNNYDIHTDLTSRIIELESIVDSHERHQICLENIRLLSERDSSRNRMSECRRLLEDHDRHDEYIRQLNSYRSQCRLIDGYRRYLHLIIEYTDMVIERYRSDIQFRAQQLFDAAFPGTSIHLEYPIRDDKGSFIIRPKFVIRFTHSYGNKQVETIFMQQAGSIKMCIEVILRLCNIIMDDSRSKFIFIDEGFGALDKERSDSFRVVFEQMKSDLQFALVIDHSDGNAPISHDRRLTIQSVNGFSSLVA